MTSDQDIRSKEVRARLVSLGLDPDVVDLEWIANMESDVESAIDAYRKEPEFIEAKPLFEPEQSLDKTTREN
jgi:hypothetical protein